VSPSAERRARRGHRPVDVARVAAGDLAEGLGGGRIDDGQEVAAVRGDGGVGDEVEVAHGGRSGRCAP
jgi:hypothetical protein